MDSSQWRQEIGIVKGMEGISSSNTCIRPVGGGGDRKVRPQEQLNCPRCNSANTKFCYYNNYSLTQPRYFCKTCRRYWTEGGSLRNVPVGGGSRKNKKSTISSSSNSSSSTSSISPNFSEFPNQNRKFNDAHDLNLAFPAMDNSNQQSQSFSALDLLRNGINPSRGMNPFIPNLMPDSNSAIYPSGFAFQELKPSIGLSDDHGVGNRYGNGVEENGGRILFPFGGFKQISSSTEGGDHGKGQGNAGGYWNGMSDGGGSW